MPVLSRKENREDYRLVGVHLPSSANNIITLFTLAKGMAKSSLFKFLIDNWIKDVKKENSEEELIEMLVLRIQHQWQARKEKHPRASFNEYKDKVRSELLSKGLERKQVNLILSQFKG